MSDDIFKEWNREKPRVSICIVLQDESIFLIGTVAAKYSLQDSASSRLNAPVDETKQAELQDNLIQHLGASPQKEMKTRPGEKVIMS